MGDVCVLDSTILTVPAHGSGPGEITAASLPRTRTLPVFGAQVVDFMVRPERFELPASWFVAAILSYATAIRSTLN